MAVSIKEEGLLLLDPGPDFVIDSAAFPDQLLNTEEPELEEEREGEGVDAETKTKSAGGPPADIELEKLPRQSSSLNCRQVKTTEREQSNKADSWGCTAFLRGFPIEMLRDFIRAPWPNQ